MTHASAIRKNTRTKLAKQYRVLYREERKDYPDQDVDNVEIAKKIGTIHEEGEPPVDFDGLILQPAMTAVADEPDVQTLQRREREPRAEELALGARVWNVVMDPSHSDSGLWGSLMQENAFNQTTNHVFAGSRRERHLATKNLMSARDTVLYDECVWHFDTEADRNEREKRQLVRLLAPQPEGRITNARAERPSRRM